MNFLAKHVYLQYKIMAFDTPFFDKFENITTLLMKLKKKTNHRKSLTLFILNEFQWSKNEWLKDALVQTQINSSGQLYFARSNRTPSSIISGEAFWGKFSTNHWKIASATSSICCSWLISLSTSRFGSPPGFWTLMSFFSFSSGFSSSSS